MHRDPRPLFVLAIMGGFLLLIVVTGGPLAGGRGAGGGVKIGAATRCCTGRC